jgi:D-amino-acid dehydrogenase
MGGDDLDMDSPELAVLFAALEDTARRYLPAAYAQALADNSLRLSRRACIRPFTPTGLGIFEVLGTVDGGRMVITTGHNTGGFSQAPEVARAVTATLNGSFHSMQEIYDPERGLRH